MFVKKKPERLMFGGQFFDQEFPETFECIKNLPYEEIVLIASSPYHCTNITEESVERARLKRLSVDENRLWFEIEDLSGASSWKWPVDTGMYPGYKLLVKAVCDHLRIPENIFNQKVREQVRKHAEACINWFARTYPMVYAVDGYDSTSGSGPFWGAYVDRFFQNFNGSKEELYWPPKRTDIDPRQHHKEKQELEFQLSRCEN